MTSSRRNLNRLIKACQTTTRSPGSRRYSLTELLMSITLFSVTLAGAIGAINAIDNLTTSYVSEGEQREANHADFSNAYDRISQNLDPLPPLAEQANFGLRHL